MYGYGEIAKRKREKKKASSASESRPQCPSPLSSLGAVANLPIPIDSHLQNAEISTQLNQSIKKKPDQPFFPPILVETRPSNPSNPCTKQKGNYNAGTSSLTQSNSNQTPASLLSNVST